MACSGALASDIDGMRCIMDRCVVLVDAGYLLGGTATSIAGDADRSQLDVDYPALVEALKREIEERTGVGVLRVMWYDAAPESRPQPEHRTLRVLPDVKVRLGDLVRRNGRWVQKGVDSFIQRDMTTLARNQAVSELVLVGGDEDLRRAVEEAQDYGVRVQVWGVEAASPEYNQSQTLIAEADRRWVLPVTWLSSFIKLRSEESDSFLRDQLAEAHHHHGVDMSSDDSQAGAVTPAAVARRVEHLNRDIVTPRGTRRIAPSPIPTLRDLTTPAQTWQDTEDDTAHPLTDPLEIGGRFGGRWVERASGEDLMLLRGEDPILPRALDGELLRYADRMGLDTWEDENAKHSVRGGFWKVARDPNAVEHHHGEREASADVSGPAIAAPVVVESDSLTAIVPTGAVDAVAEECEPESETA